MEYILNAFSLQMLKNQHTQLQVTEIDHLPEFWTLESFPYMDDGGIPGDFDDDGIPHCEYKQVETGIISAVGHQDTAHILGVPCNRINVTLEKGDTAFVAQLQGGRLPEGTTTLPEGFSFKFFKVTIN